MRLGYDKFIKDKVKSVLKDLAIQIGKILRSTKPFVSVCFSLVCLSVTFIRFEHTQGWDHLYFPHQCCACSCMVLGLSLTCSSRTKK